MKTALLIVILLLINLSIQDKRVQITLYEESLCPDCQDFIKSSFKYAVYTQNFEKICDYQIVPFGNGKQKQLQSGQWSFTCQHGTKECEGNLWETCIVKLHPAPLNAKLVICLEGKINYQTTWSYVVQDCASQFDVDFAQLKECYSSTQANQWQHEFASQTEALNPPHNYVPWITVNGKHNVTQENAVLQNMLKFVCQTYEGPEKIVGCEPFNSQELIIDQ